MNYEVAIEVLKDEIWTPTDHTRSFWYRDRWGGILWSENDEPNPDYEEWDESYSSERFREVTERSGYIIGTVEDGCDGEYQVIFSKEKELIDNPFS